MTAIQELEEYSDYLKAQDSFKKVDEAIFAYFTNEVREKDADTILIPLQVMLNMDEKTSTLKNLGVIFYGKERNYLVFVTAEQLLILLKGRFFDAYAFSSPVLRR